MFWQICDIAPDSADCCALARKLALKLSDGNVDGTLPTIGTGEERGAHTTASVGGVEGEDPQRNWLVFWQPAPLY